MKKFAWAISRTHFFFFDFFLSKFYYKNNEEFFIKINVHHNWFFQAFRNSIRPFEITRTLHIWPFSCKPVWFCPKTHKWTILAIFWLIKKSLESSFMQQLAGPLLYSFGSKMPNKDSTRSTQNWPPTPDKSQAPTSNL